MLLLLERLVVLHRAGLHLLLVVLHRLLVVLHLQGFRLRVQVHLVRLGGLLRLLRLRLLRLRLLRLLRLLLRLPEERVPNEWLRR